MGNPETEISWIDYLKTIDAPTLSNAIELLKVRPNREGFTPLQVRALFPEFGRMCGHAVTAQVETITESEPQDAQRFVELYRAVEQSAKPAVIAFQEIGVWHNLAGFRRGPSRAYALIVGKEEQFGLEDRPPDGAAKLIEMRGLDGNPVQVAEVAVRIQFGGLVVLIRRAMKLLVPLLVVSSMTPPLTLPYSAAKLLV